MSFNKMLELEETNIDNENMTLPNNLDDFPLPVFDSRQIPFSPTSPGKRSPGRPRTMKEYEEDLATLKKENFNLKVRIYFLEQHRIDPTLPKDVDELRHLYTNLKVEHDLQKKDLETKESLLLDTYKALDVQKQQLEAVTEERQELRIRIENLEKELRDYHQRFMETSVPLLDDTNALYSVTFGLNAKPGLAKADSAAEDKIRELQEDLAKEKGRALALEEEICHLREQSVGDEKIVKQLSSQVQEMEENLEKMLAERNRYEELYGQASGMVGKLDKSLRKKMEFLKEKGNEADKWKSLAEELRKQLTRVEKQLQEIQEKPTKSHTATEKQLKLLFAENDKLKQEVKYLQHLAEKRTSKSRSSSDQELKEAQSQLSELVREVDALKAHLSQSKAFIQTIYKEKKQLQAQVEKLKARRVPEESRRVPEGSSKEEVL